MDQGVEQITDDAVVAALRKQAFRIKLRSFVIAVVATAVVWFLP